MPSLDPSLPEQPPANPVEVRVDLDPRINFAMQQNDVPVVKTIRVENRGEAMLRDLEVRIEAEPGFAQAWTTRIAAVAPHAVYNLEAVDLDLSPGFLGELTERVRGRLRVEVRRDAATLAEQICAVELLAREEWGGLRSLQEILAAFVLPNHPAVEGVLRAAAEHLGRWTGDPSLNGYQTKTRRRAYEIAGALYAGLQQQGITYVNPPASFEEEGQRVRLPDRILDSRMGTCLDLALFAAACLEQAGLHPLVVLVRGHAFVGVWLQDECFAEPAVEDGLTLRKRVELSELAVFDPTFVTHRPPVPFERAVAEAKRGLQEEEAFLCAIDVRRARKGRIRPLPERVAHTEREETSVASASSMPAPAEPAAPDPSSIVEGSAIPSAEAEPAAETPATRLDRWCRKLLDLSLRNRLLNFRESKKTLPLLCPDLGLLEDLLAAGSTLRILPRPRDLSEADPRDPEAHLRRTGEEALGELLRDELRARRLHASTTPEELDRRLVEIYRAARLGLEEGGASTLYLALGMLAWFESPTSAQRRLAPLLLLPLEIHRRSVREGFSLKLSDDEPRINVTLLEMLKRDHGLSIPGLDPLPEDESGFDVPAILRTVRQAVRDIPRWDVVEEAWVGLFSFTKFLMWRDLSERTTELMKNPVVAHLVNRPDQVFDPGAVFPRPERLDDEHAPTDTFCPLPADSSQLAAVFAAAEGRSFVLEGPPGTGKSQTITNLISHCLTEGKTVLFVSEKMAALNVVHRRLANVGLGRYCLELHSNKAHKQQVLKQLGQALERHREEGTDSWAHDSRRLAELRNELNAYVRALHLKRSTGETVYQATSRLIGLRDTPRVALRWPAPDALDADALASLRDLVEQLATASKTCGEIARHPWAAVRRAQWTPGWQEEVAEALEAFRNAIESLAEHAASAGKRIGLRDGGGSLEQLERLREVSLALMGSPSPPAALLVRTDWDEIQDRIGAWIEHGRTRDRVRADVHARFRPEIAELDLDELHGRFEQASRSWWPASWWRCRHVRNELRSVALDGTAPPREELGRILERARELRTEQRHLDAAAEEARALLGRYWNDGEAEWDGLSELRTWAQGLRSLALRVGGDNFGRVASLRERWAQLASEGRELLATGGSIADEFVAYGAALTAFAESRARVANLLDLEAESVWGDAAAPDAIGRARQSLVGWQSAEHRLRDWCAWRRVHLEAVRLGLAPLVEAHERREVSADQLRPVFERSYAQWWLAAVTDREPVLSGFFSPEHERKIEQFRAIDDRHLSITSSVVQARLMERVPATSASAMPNSEMGVLMREVGKRRRHMPVRQLLHRIPTILPRLKPCLLMSPMSVAQYLGPEYPPFDIVVFDEASQIPVWDAIGAIARGRQAVIVGDPKQLPPTSFFQRSEGEDDEAANDDVVEDLESILDDCISARIPWLPLDWHYRSRHEGLITFSNYHYYGNRLLTFPSPALEGMGVTWRQVPDGVYDKGKSRTNRREADEVVAEIVRRLRDPLLCCSSIGVVTFSQAQQTLIEDLLDVARLRDPELDPYFAEDRLEPVFVKNLENVQGDERDVILFSIGYGPDATGRVSMNFGPMNRDGGERRLNVAITRARREVLVFSTLRADQIDLSRTRATGVRDLKNFLEYAERGPAAIAEAIRLDPDADFDSPFEEAVFDALVQRGWQVHKQVGCASYRIDLAVVDPAAPGRYLLGVECDGANYHRAKTARDRDKLREGVLRDLGWQLHRIWSTDWWTDPHREIEKLEGALERAREVPATAAAEHPPAAEQQRIASAPAPISAPSDPPAFHELEYSRYRATPDCAAIGTQPEFYEPGADRKILERLVEVVRCEGPISLALAARRVSAAWGFERVRARATERVTSVIPRDEIHVQRDVGGTFLWSRDMLPEAFESFRVPTPDGSGLRDAEDLPREEIANALLHLLRSHGGAPESDLIREVARLFGFQRTGRIVQERMLLGLRLLEETGRVERRGGTIAATAG